MNEKREKKGYTLEYIEKIFRVIPLTFILILTIVSIFITFIILEAKQSREIDLLLQKEALHNEFDKKEQLLNFSTKVKSRVDLELLKINKILQEHTYKVIGRLENSAITTKNLSFTHYENEHSIDIVLFRQKDMKIIYGEDKISFLSELIFGEVNNTYEKIVLQYIASQGRYNLQEWKNDLTGALRLSFFDALKIDGESYFLGTFSKIENIRFITKNSIIEEINSLEKASDYSIWFYDLITKITYNFQNKALYDNANVLLSSDNEKMKYKILKYFDKMEEEHPFFENYTLYDTRYKFLTAVDYSTDVTIDEKKIVEKYHSLFLSITMYIIIIGALFVIFSLLFSNFAKKILDRYNKKLQEQTDSLTHWKNRFELAIIASNDGLWDIDFEEDKIYFSQKWLEISGYEKGEIKNFSDWFSLIHNDEKDKVENIFESIFSNQRDDFLCEYRLRTKNEGFKWILGRGRLFIDKESGHKRMLMMSMDIDKSKRLKKELLDVELLVEDGKIVIFKLHNNENLNVKFISNSIKNYGYSKEMFECSQMNFLDLIYEEDRDIVNVAVNAALNNDLPDFTFVCRAINAANEIRWISCRTILIKNHSGEVIHFYGYINDITKIKLSEEELKEKVALEVEKNRDKDKIMIQQSKLAAMGEMIGAIAHQWRQPLNNVSLFLHFLKDNYNNDAVTVEKIEKYFDRASYQIQYMSETIDDFRNFYKPSKQASEFIVKHAINSTYEILKVQLQDEEIAVSIECDATTIINYENELRQSLLNIITNAKDAILTHKEDEKFEPQIIVASTKTSEGVCIEIKNNGGAISEDILSRIFEPYFTTKFETQGTGIGLYMTKTIIEKNMKGTIEVMNLDNEWVKFTIVLPKGVSNV